jgi:hypothetical protein
MGDSMPDGISILPINFVTATEYLEGLSEQRNQRGDFSEFER